MTWSKGRIVSRRDWAEGLFSLSVEGEIETYEPGQFLNVGLYFDADLVFRAYSIASPPGSPLEFYLTEVSGGRLTERMNRLQAGDEVWVERHPQGFFRLRYVPDAQELWLIATGTGLGPFMAMLRDETIWQRFPRLFLVHGVRERSQLGYGDAISELVRQRGGQLSYLPVLSRDAEATGVLHGRVTTVLENGRLEELAGVRFDPERSHVLLCGNPEMIVDVSRLLEARGLRKHRQRNPGHITTEKYW